MAQHVVRPIPLERSKGVTYKFTYLVGFGSPEDRAAYAWYIEGPGEKILVDTGCDIEGLTPSPAMFPLDSDYMQIQKLDEALAKVQLKPEDIDIVILTHMHEDHVQLARSYPNARFIVQKAELEAARNPHPLQQWTYLNDSWDDIKFDVVEGDQEITDGVSVVLTPGHSAGAQSIVVDTAEGKAVITGFCSIDRNFYPPEGVPTPVIAPGILLDIQQAYDSVLKVKEMADIIIPIHDIKFLGMDSVP